MRRMLTGEQLRFLWRETGGDLLKRPLQVLGSARTRREAALHAEHLHRWWQAAPDPGLLDAVRGLRRPRLWLECTAVDEDARPARGLLAVGAGVSVLVRQEPVADQEDEDAPMTAACGPGHAPAWSRDRGGDCLVETGHADELVRLLCADLPRFPPAGDAEMSAPLAALRPGRRSGDDAVGDGYAGDGYSRRATVAPAERMRALSWRPRRFEAQFTVSEPVGAAGEEPRARLVWLVGEDGGRLFDGPGVLPGASGAPAAAVRTVRMRPAGTGSLERAVRALLSRAGAAPR